VDGEHVGGVIQSGQVCGVKLEGCGHKGDEEEEGEGEEDEEGEEEEEGDNRKERGEAMVAYAVGCDRRRQRPLRLLRITQTKRQQHVSGECGAVELATGSWWHCAALCFLLLQVDCGVVLAGLTAVDYRLCPGV